jgi:hypothetical protein
MIQLDAFVSLLQWLKDYISDYISRFLSVGYAEVTAFMIAIQA